MDASFSSAATRDVALLTFALGGACLAVVAQHTHFLSGAIRWLRKDPLVRVLLVVVLFGTGPITSRSKDGVPDRSVQSTQTSETTPSFVCHGAKTNGVAMVGPTTNAIVSQACLLHGASETGEWIESEAPFFRWGTNDIRRLYASPGCLSFGTKRHPYLGDSLPNGTPAESLAALRMPLGIVPEANWNFLEGTGVVSRFWHDNLPGGGRVFTWENTLLDRLSDRPATVQVELRQSGDFVYRYDFSQAAPTNAFLVGAQKAAAAVEALRIGNAETNSATVYRLDGDTATNGVSIADLFATAPLLELRWKNVSGLGDLSGDTDDDGLTDWDEVFLHGTDPLDPDTDGDGMADGAEMAEELCPTNPDEDENGIPDGEEESVWRANPLWANIAGETNLVLRVLRSANPGTFAYARLGSLTIPISYATNYYFSIQEGIPVTLELFSYGDSFAQLSLDMPDQTMPPSFRGGTGSTESEGNGPQAFFVVDPQGYTEGEPLVAGRNCSLVLMLSRLVLQPVGNPTTHCVHEFPGERRYRPVFPEGFWPELSRLAVLDGFLLDGADLVLSVGDNPRSIATGTIAFPPRSSLASPLSASETIHRCESSAHSFCQLCSDASYSPPEIERTRISRRTLSSRRSEVSLSAGTPASANWTIEPVLQGGARLYRSSEESGEGASSIADAETIWISPGNIPQEYTVTAVHPECGVSADTLEFWALDVALEPIVSLVDTNGVIVNPAGTILHRPTPFFAEIAPLTFAERGLLSWGGIEGDYADENNALVHVSPNETGLQTLSLYLEGYEDPVPTISAEVFPSNSLVSVNLFLIVDAQGNVPVGYDPSIMSNAVSLANRTFAQAAMEFVWDGSCTIVTNQSWYSTVLSLPVEGERDFVNELCEFCPDSAGVTVFLNTSFTNRVGSSVALTLSTGIPGVTHGILIPIGMLELALQHELGHACGLIDIFPMSSPFQQEPSLNDRIVSIQKMPGDWTGEWGYYRTDVTMVDVIHRMLMFNLNLPGVEFGMDIPSGPVRGYNVKGDSGMLSVGLEALSRTPVSRRLIP